MGICNAKQCQESTEFDKTKKAESRYSCEKIKESTDEVYEENFFNFWNRDQTFKPMRRCSTMKQKTLIATMQATLGTAHSSREQVKLPEGESLDEWLAVNTIHFYNIASLIYGSCSTFCTDETCSTMSAGKTEYFWKDGKDYKKPTKVTAPRYMELLLNWIEDQITDPKIFPIKEGQKFPSKFYTIIKNIYKRIFRLYAHVYYSHFDKMKSIGANAHLNSCFKHFIFFVLQFRLIDKEGLAPLRDSIDKFELEEDEAENRLRGYQIELDPIKEATNLQKEKDQNHKQIQAQHPQETQKAQDAQPKNQPKNQPKHQRQQQQQQHQQHHQQHHQQQREQTSGVKVIEKQTEKQQQTQPIKRDEHQQQPHIWDLSASSTEIDMDDKALWDISVSSDEENDNCYHVSSQEEDNIHYQVSSEEDDSVAYRFRFVTMREEREIQPRSNGRVSSTKSSSTCGPSSTRSVTQKTENKHPLRSKRDKGKDPRHLKLRVVQKSPRAVLDNTFLQGSLHKHSNSSHKQCSPVHIHSKANERRSISSNHQKLRRNYKHPHSFIQPTRTTPLHLPFEVNKKLKSVKEVNHEHKWQNIMNNLSDSRVKKKLSVKLGGRRLEKSRKALEMTGKSAKHDNLHHHKHASLMKSIPQEYKRRRSLEHLNEREMARLSQSYCNKDSNVDHHASDSSDGRIYSEDMRTYIPGPKPYLKDINREFKRRRSISSSRVRAKKKKSMSNSTNSGRIYSKAMDADIPGPKPYLKDINREVKRRKSISDSLVRQKGKMCESSCASSGRIYSEAMNPAIPGPKPYLKDISREVKRCKSFTRQKRMKSFRNSSANRRAKSMPLFEPNRKDDRAVSRRESIRTVQERVKLRQSSCSESSPATKEHKRVKSVRSMKERDAKEMKRNIEENLRLGNRNIYSSKQIYLSKLEQYKPVKSEFSEEPFKKYQQQLELEQEYKEASRIQC